VSLLPRQAALCFGRPRGGGGPATPPTLCLVPLDLGIFNPPIAPALLSSDGVAFDEPPYPCAGYAETRGGFGGGHLNFNLQCTPHHFNVNECAMFEVVAAHRNVQFDRFGFLVNIQDFDRLIGSKAHINCQINEILNSILDTGENWLKFWHLGCFHCGVLRATSSN